MLKPETIQTLIKEIQEVHEEPSQPFPFIELHTEELGSIRLTFFTFDTQSSTVFAAIGTANETPTKTKLTLQKIAQSKHWAVAAITMSGDQVRLRISEWALEGFEELHQVLRTQGGLE